MIRKVVSSVVLIVFLVWTAYYVSQNTEDFAPIRQVRLSDMLMLTAAFLAIMVCNGLFISTVSRAFQIQLTSLEWLSLSFSSSLANYFLPFRGGAGLRAIYMSKLHGFPITEFLSTLSVMYIMHVVVNGAMALIGMGLIAADGGKANNTLLAFFLLLTLAGILAMTINLKSKADHEWAPLALLHRLFAAWQKVRTNGALVVRMWVLMLVLTMATVWQCRTAFDAVSIPLSTGGILVYAASKNLATLVSLTPGSLGIVELISIYLGGVLNYSTADALSVQALIRSVAIAVLLIFGPFAFLFLQRRIRQSTP